MTEADKLERLARQSRALWRGAERRYSGRLADHTAQSRAILPAPCGGKHPAALEPGSAVDSCPYCGAFVRWSTVGVPSAVVGSAK